VAIVQLLGHGISYSASPAMQNAGFEALGTSHQYELADVASSALRQAVEALRDPAFLGANVTQPYKERVFYLMDDVDEVGRSATAVNTIVNRGGRLIGSNTDVPAIVDEIRSVQPDPQRAVILGAGGAGRAVQVALESMRVEDVVVVSRTGNDGTVPWSSLGDVLRPADLVVNATPVGMNDSRSPIRPELMHAGLAVLDLVYRPSPTLLVHDARAAGLEARAGAGVLHGQGWRSLQAWLGIEVSEDVKRAMADALAAELGDGVDV
jgi:shikimate dehydrogenase